MSVDRVGPERRSESPVADVATAASADAAVNATAINTVLEVLRDAGFIPR